GVCDHYRRARRAWRGLPAAGGMRMTGMSDTMMEFLDKFAEAWNRHDLDTIMSMMTADCVFEASAGDAVTGQRYEGQEAVRASFAAVFEQFPDAHWGG